MYYYFFAAKKNTTLILTLLFICILPQLNANQNFPCMNRAQTSFHIDYKETKSELCMIGVYYDTYKSWQLSNFWDGRHCHPYTRFYNSLFKDVKDEELVIGEIGILYGSSMILWREFFKNASLYGFEHDNSFNYSFKNNYDNDRIELVQINVHDQQSISEAFLSTNVQYDLIIEDSTHQFEDQLRVIENVYSYLKPGGMLVIEDIFKSYSEQNYIERLKPILHNFQDYYFVTLDHKNRNSAGWDNDKLFVLVKAGATPIFKNKKKITIITPSIRPSNLQKIKESIDFNYVNEWIIVYDGKKIIENPNQFEDEGNSKIKEYVHMSEGTSGNPQRNFALDHIENEDTYLYYLDDDNMIHKDLYKLLDIIDDDKIYTFDQENRINGNHIALGRIDTAMFLVDFKLCKDIRWVLDKYEADFYYINQCYSQNKNKWIYVNNVLSTYNTL